MKDRKGNVLEDGDIVTNGKNETTIQINTSGILTLLDLPSICGVKPKYTSNSILKTNWTKR